MNIQLATHRQLQGYIKDLPNKNYHIAKSFDNLQFYSSNKIIIESFDCFQTSLNYVRNILKCSLIFSNFHPDLDLEHELKASNLDFYNLYLLQKQRYFQEELCGLDLVRASSNPHPTKRGDM